MRVFSKIDDVLAKNWGIIVFEQILALISPQPRCSLIKKMEIYLKQSLISFKEEPQPHAKNRLFRKIDQGRHQFV